MLTSGGLQPQSSGTGQVRRHALAWAACALALAADAQGAGFLRVDSSSFLKRSVDRADSSTAVSVGPDFDGEGRWVRGALSLEAITFVGDKSSFTIESKEAFVATSRRWMPHHQLTVGRRIFDWSAADDHWKLGIWSPRFTWDPLRPETRGLDGAYYMYESRSWRLVGWVTPVSIPERGYPIREESGKLRSASPFFIPPYDSLLLMKQQVDIRYSIVYPSIREVLLRPGAGLSLKYGQAAGPWAGASYGYKRVNPIDLGVQVGLNSIDSVIDAQLSMREIYHHLLTVEAGWRSRRFSLWLSGTAEKPNPRAVDPAISVQPVGPTVIAAGGIEGRPLGSLTLGASALNIAEELPKTDSAAIPIKTPSRHLLRRAVRLGAHWDGPSALDYAMAWTGDLGEKSHLFSLDLNYTPDTSWRVGVGTDFIATATGKGWIGQFEGNDRVRGRVTYAF